MRFIKTLITKVMARIEHKKFIPTPAEASEGATPMSKIEILNSIAAYKLQNPKKYETKKEALFARYGLALEEEVPEVAPDANDIEIAKIAKKLKKDTK